MVIKGQKIDERTVTEDLRLKFFRIAWLASFLAHFDQRLEWMSSPLHVGLCISAFIAILWSEKPVYFFIAIGLQVLLVATEMPIVDNHWFFSAFLNLLILLPILGTLSINRAVPSLQVLIGLMYFFAAFHKWNSGFLDSSESCAIDLYNRIQSFPLIPAFPALETEGLQRMQIYGILLLESSLPLLFLWRRMWFWAISTGVFFHLLTSLFLRHYPSTLFALYWLMIPKGILEQVLNGYETPKVLLKFKVYLIGCTGLFLAAFVWLKATGAPDPHSADSPRWLALRIWSLSALFLYLYLLKALWPHRKLQPEPLKLSKFQWAFVLVFLLNGFSPYLGLKTTTSFSMWSNLKVNEQGSNHLLLSSTEFRIFPFEDEFFEVETTNLQVLKNSSELYSISELRRIIETTQSLNPEKLLELQVKSNRGIYLLQDLQLRSDWKSLDWWPLKKLVAIHSLHPETKSCEW